MGFTVWTTVWVAVNSLKAKELAERVGFEPTLPFRVNTLSKRAPSATRPSLRRQSIQGNLERRSQLRDTTTGRSRAGMHFIILWMEAWARNLRGRNLYWDRQPLEWTPAKTARSL